MSKGALKIVVPRNNPIDAFTMAAIVRDAGMTIEEFKKLLRAMMRADWCSALGICLRFGVWCLEFSPSCVVSAP